ncbi:unnamed protein product [Rhizoctonia solani]|uniref:Uncharacterized protein n=1 Tax=Rhizoctonia solani TaxID=456999 RepID=A0A8H3GH47_9AGAM|nr:unnamed protein product [Rhizoctonia solani]
MMPFRNPIRRRATAPAECPSESVGSPHSTTQTRSLARPRNSTIPPALPPVKRYSMKKLRKFYMSNLSSKSGSLQDQNIISASYYQLGDTTLIRLEASPVPGSTSDTLLLESPRPNKGPGMPWLIRNISQSNTMKSIGLMIPIAPNLGYFSRMSHKEADTYMRDLKPSSDPKVITYQNPLPFDNLVVLASRISSRRSRRSLDSPPKSWFIQAMWEGLKRIKEMQDNNATADENDSQDGGNTLTDISKMVDGVMDTFGDSLLLFHYKVMKIQQKSDHSMTAVEERKNIVQQEILERNREITSTQANWHTAEQERERLRRRESDLRKQLRLSDPIPQ